MPKNIIIGGGLSGLTLAYQLHKNNQAFTLLEGAERLGGRIQTLSGTLGTPLELGATWISDLHTELLALLKELNIEVFEQYMKGISYVQIYSNEPPEPYRVPDSEPPSYRIAGGSEALISALVAKLPQENIHLNSKVTTITEQGSRVQVGLANGDTLTGDKVFVCLPPQLAGNSIRYSPALPKQFAEFLPTVQTWMAGSVKFVLEYEHPFWRDNGYSGMLFGRAGIVSEMYDHTNYEGNRYGFTGFLNTNALYYPTRQERKAKVLEYLTSLFGKEAMHPTLYTDKIWVDEWILGDNDSIPFPHHHNGHPILRDPYMNGKLHFVSTETAATFSGYMEGAVRNINLLIGKLAN